MFKINKSLIIIYILAFLLPLGNSLGRSFFPIYIKDLGYSIATVGLFVAIAGLGDAVLRITAGAKCDKIGRRKLILTGIIMNFIFASGLIYAKAYVPLLILNVLGMAAMGVFWTGMTASLFDFCPPKKEGRYFSVMVMLAIAGAFLGPYFAGVIIGSAGYTLLFSMSAYIFIPPIVMVGFIKGTKIKEQKMSFYQESMDVIKKKSFMKVWVTMMMAFMLSSFFGTFFPIFLKENLAWSYVAIGSFISVLSLFMAFIQIPIGKLADGIKSKFLIPTGFLLGAVGNYLIGTFTNTIGLFISAAFVRFNTYNANVKLSSIVVKMTPKEEHGLANALLKSSYGIGTFIICMIAQSIITRIGFESTFKLLSALGLVVGALYFISYTKTLHLIEKKVLELKKHHFIHVTEAYFRGHHFWHFKDKRAKK